MLTINIIAVGKLKEKYLKQAIDEYSKRLKTMCKFVVVEINEYKICDNPSKKDIDKALEMEMKTISSYLNKASYNIAMCIEGKKLSSTDLADVFEKVAVNGKSTINFIIGSSHGIYDELKKYCDLKLSMSDMTFPHQLARVMLTEQIYRALSINNNTKYHK